MTKWVILLRTIGTLLTLSILFYIIWEMNNGIAYGSQINFLLQTTFHLAVAMLCFAVASALKQIQRQDRKLNYIANSVTSRRQPRPVNNPSPPTNYPMPPSMRYPEPLDLAPNEPTPVNTSRYLEDGEIIRHNGSGRRVLRRVDQEYIDRKYAYRVSDPEVRKPPKPIRQSPGAAGQYMDEELADTKKRALPTPSNPFTRSIEEVPDKELLRLGREAYLRRQQHGQE